MSTGDPEHLRAIAPLIRIVAQSTMDLSAPPGPRAMDLVHGISRWKLNLGKSICLAILQICP
jgi:hypothetical protein